MSVLLCGVLISQWKHFASLAVLPFFYYLLFEFIAKDSTLYRCIARATIYDITSALATSFVVHGQIDYSLY